MSPGALVRIRGLVAAPKTRHGKFGTSWGWIFLGSTRLLIGLLFGFNINKDEGGYGVLKRLERFDTVTYHGVGHMILGCLRSKAIGF